MPYGVNKGLSGVTPGIGSNLRYLARTELRYTQGRPCQTRTVGALAALPSGIKTEYR